MKSIVAILLAGSFVVGCSAASEPTAGSSAAQAVTVGGISSASLKGTWTDAGFPSDGSAFQTLTLAASTFTEVVPCTSSGVESCHSILQITGKWKLDTSGPQLGAPEGVPQIVLTDSSDNVTSYFVSLSSDESTLSLSSVYGVHGPANSGWLLSRAPAAATGHADIEGTYALTGTNQTPYTSFQILHNDEQGYQYFATGLCVQASWGEDCTQAPQYGGSWSTGDEVLTFTGDISATYNYAVIDGVLHLWNSSGAPDTLYKKESTNGHFAANEDCADMYGNPLGTCNGGDSWACTYVGPGSNEMVCAPQN
jgi:hypothetical protein